MDGAAILDLPPSVIAVAVRCVEPIRAADALHVASAREFDAALFLSSDRSRCRAGERFGIRGELV